MRGREKLYGSILESAKPFYEKLRAADERLQSLKGADRDTDDFENDALVEVFGQDTRGCLRGVGSTISKRQLSHMDVASQKLQQLEQNDASNQQMRQDIIKLNTKLNGFGTLMEVYFVL